MGKWYLYFIVVAGFFGSMMSHAPSRPPSERPPAFAEHEREYKFTRGEDPSPAVTVPQGALTLERESDGHFYADVELNGSRVRMLVDTGASGIALSRDDARRAGLAPSAGMSEVVGEGASGEVRGEYVTLDRVALGSATAEHLPAVILDAGQQSLLGQAFLSKFDSVEIQGDTMVLR